MGAPGRQSYQIVEGQGEGRKQTSRSELQAVVFATMMLRRQTSQLDDGGRYSVDRSEKKWNKNLGG